MAKTIKHNQNLFDAVIEQYGSLADIVQCASENNISITGFLTIGRKISTPVLDVDKPVLNYITNNNYTIATNGGNLKKDYRLPQGFPFSL
jgi:hypothetical protein